VPGCTVCLSFDIDAYSPMLFEGEQSPAALSRGEFSGRVGAPRVIQRVGAKLPGGRQPDDHIVRMLVPQPRHLQPPLGLAPAGLLWLAGAHQARLARLRAIPA